MLTSISHDFSKVARTTCLEIEPFGPMTSFSKFDKKKSKSKKKTKKQIVIDKWSEQTRKMSAYLA